MLTVACVLRSGGVYNAEYVAKLQFGITRHLSIPHKFVCLTDSDVACEKIPLKHDWPGWWPKIELFKLSGPVLYFDLDTIIVGDLSDIAQQAMKPEFTILRNFYHDNGYGSGLMGWTVNLERLYDTFAKDPIGWKKKAYGDQNFIEQNMSRKDVTIWQDRLPGQIVSYKAHVRKAENCHETGDGTVPDGTRVVCFHGNPRPHEVDWAA